MSVTDFSALTILGSLPAGFLGALTGLVGEWSSSPCSRCYFTST